MENSPKNQPINPEFSEGNEGRSKTPFFRTLHRVALLALLAGSTVAMDGCATQKKDSVPDKAAGQAETTPETPVPVADLLGKKFTCNGAEDKSPVQAAKDYFAKKTGLDLEKVDEEFEPEILDSQKKAPFKIVAKVKRKPAPEINPRPVPEWIVGMIPGTIEFNTTSRGLAGATNEAYWHVANQLKIGIDAARANYTVTVVEFDRNLRRLKAKVEANKEDPDAPTIVVSAHRDLDKDHDLEALRHQMLALVNEDRKANTLSALEADKLLDQFAQYRSDQMASRSVSNPIVNPAENILRKNQIEAMPIAENISIFGSLREAEEAWMKDGSIAEFLKAGNSSRGNILSKQFRRVGFGITKLKDGRLVLVQLFSKPALTFQEQKDFMDLTVNLVDSDSFVLWFVKFIRALPSGLDLPDDLITDGQLDMKRLKAWALDFYNNPNPKQIKVLPSSFKFVQWLVGLFSDDLKKKLGMLKPMMDENGVIEPDALKTLIGTFLKLDSEDSQPSKLPPP